MQSNNTKRLTDRVKIAVISSIVIAVIVGTISASIQVSRDNDKTPETNTHITTLASDMNSNNQQVDKQQVAHLDGVVITFETEPRVIRPLELTSIKMNVSDQNSGQPITHVDWSVIIKNAEGEEVYKTNTLHTHVGVLHFNYAFLAPGEYTVSVQVASLGPKMMGMDVPAMAQTRILLSGDPMNGWQTDPNLFFGTRNTEFKVNVEGQGGINVVDGTEAGTSIAVRLATNPDRLVTGQPITLIFEVKDPDGNDVTHVEGRVNIIGALIPSVYTSPPMGSDMMPMMGALHGHTGQFALTTAFPASGKYIVRVDLNSLPVSNYIFGQASARFVLNVEDGTTQGRVTTSVEQKQNQIVILGQDPPFYSPNNITVKAGTPITVINSDAIIHTLTATHDNIDVVSPTASNEFDTGLLRFGEQKQIIVNEPGTYNYFCMLHPFMRGSITVTG